MLGGRVVQFLGNALALFLLQVNQALGQLLRFLLQSFALGDVGDHTHEAEGLLGCR